MNGWKNWNWLYCSRLICRFCAQLSSIFPWQKARELLQKSGARDKKLAILYTCYSLICCREMYFLQISAEKWRMYFTSPKMDFILRMLLLFYGTWNLKHTHSVLIHLFSWMNLCCVHKYLCTLLWNYSDLS